MGAENLVGDVVAVPPVDLVHAEDGEEIVLRGAQGDVGVQVKLSALLDGQADRYGKELPAGQPHVFKHALVVEATHEAVQWREGADGQQLEIARGALGKLQAGKA